MNGILALEEQRSVVDGLSERYLEAYTALLDEEAAIDKERIKANWQITIGGIVANIALTFTPPAIKGIGRFAIWAGKPLIKGINKIKANYKKRQLEKKKEIIKAAFIAEDGTVDFFSEPDGNYIKTELETPTYGDKRPTINK